MDTGLDAVQKHAHAHITHITVAARMSESCVLIQWF